MAFALGENDIKKAIVEYINKEKKTKFDSNDVKLIVIGDRVNATIGVH